MHRFIAIGILLLSIFAAFLKNSLSTFEGGPHNDVRPISDEAVPLYRMSEVHWLVRYIFGYLFGPLAPVGSMNKCPTVVDWENNIEAEEARLCMKQARDMEAVDAAMTDLKSMFNEEIIFLDRSEIGGGGDPMKVTLLKKRNSQKEEEVSSKAPLILYIHGGGFVLRGAHVSVPAQIFTALLNMDDENNHSQVMEGATMALVEYRLAPEAMYPAARDDCLLALNHLVHNKGLGKGGIHIAGSSAGGALAMETTMKSLDLVDTFYLDSPMVPLPTVDDEGNESWTLDSPSARRYSYSRMPPVSWLEWCLKAYTGMETDSEKEKNLQLGSLSTNVDITGGSMSVSEWLKRTRRSTTLPRLLLVTAKGDPLQDGGLAFKGVYEKVTNEVEAKYNNDEVSRVKHFDSNHGHCAFYLFGRSMFQDVMKEWYGEIRSVLEGK